MQAIVTKFIGPTDFKGPRVKATCEARPRGVTVAWDYGVGNATYQSDVEANHDRAAVALIRAMGWFGTWIRGALPSGDGYCYVSLKRACVSGFRTPHPQAADWGSLLIVRAGARDATP